MSPSPRREPPGVGARSDRGVSRHEGSSREGISTRIRFARTTTAQFWRRARAGGVPGPGGPAGHELALDWESTRLVRVAHRVAQHRQGLLAVYTVERHGASGA